LERHKADFNRLGTREFSLSLTTKNRARVGMVLNAQSANARFLAAYHHHVVHRWKSHYIAYDGLRSIYKDIKCNKNGNGIEVFDLAIQLEIQHMNEFIDSYLEELDDRLTAISADVDTLVASRGRSNSNANVGSERAETGGKGKESDKGSEKKKKKANKDDDDDDELNAREKILDRMIREVYTDCKHVQSFLELNLFAIGKIAKKFRKLCPERSDITNLSDGVDAWANYKSYIAYREAVDKTDSIDAVASRCEEIYCTAFRTTYPELAHAELQFDKDKQQQMKKNRIGLGVKIGIILTLVSFSRARDLKIQFHI
jgi:hypothetical protein